MEFKIGDKVKLLKNGAKNTYTSIADKKNRDEAQKQEGRIGIIIALDFEIARVDTGYNISYYWYLKYVQHYDEAREQMLELEEQL